MSGFNKNLDTNSMNYLAFRKILDEEMEVSKRLRTMCYRDRERVAPSLAGHINYNKELEC